MKCRKTLDDVETGATRQHRDKVGGRTADCPTGIRHVGGVNWHQALLRNVGTCRPDAKGEAQAEATASVRVPKRGTGAESPVVGSKVL